MHGGGVNDVTGRQITGGGQGSAAKRNRTMSIAFILNGRTPSSSYSARHTGTEDQIGVGCVDDRIDLLSHNITLNYFNPVYPAHVCLP
jgi:hypothetical protein